MAITFLSDGAGGTGLSPTTTFATVFDGPRSGTVTVDTTVKNHGYGSLKHDSGASASAYVARNACLADAGRRINVRMRFDGAGASAATGILRILTAADAQVAQVALDANRNLRLYAGASGTTLQGTGTTALTLNQWYRIGISYTITSASVSEWRVYIDGILELTASNPATQVTGASKLRIGWTGTSPGANVIMYSQDYYIDDVADLSATDDIFVTSKLPSALGATNAFDTAVGTGTNRWDRVSERPANTANRYTHAGTSQVREQYTVQAANVGDDDLTGKIIVGWAPWVHWSVASNAGATTVSIVANGTDVALTSTAASGAYQTHESVVNSTSYPSGNNVVGLRSTGATADTHLAEAGVFIAYKNPLTGTRTVPASIAIDTLGGTRVVPATISVKLPITGTGIAHWQFFTDAATDGSLVALAAEDTTPVLTGAQVMGGNIRLRLQLRDTGNLTALNVEYSVDGTTWASVAGAAPTSTTVNRWFRFVNGAATANATIGSQLLTGTTVSGTYLEDSGAAVTVAASAIKEVDLAFKVIWPPPSTTIKFRILNGATPIAAATNADEIRLTTCTPSQRNYTIDKAEPNTSAGQNREVNHGPWQRLHYDGSNWWFFSIQPNDGTNLSYWKAPTDFSSGWTKNTVGMTVNAATTSEADVKHGVAFAVLGGVHVVSALFAPSSGNMHYRRGYFNSGAITWAADTDLGQTRYNPHSHVTIDDGGFHWIGGINGTSGVWACRSTAADDGSSGYVPSFGTISTRRKTVADATVASGNILALVPLASDKILVMWNTGSTLKAAVCTDAGGFGTVVTVNATANAHPADWGVTRLGNTVYVVHSDNTTTGGTWRTRLYSISGNTWSAGTDPGAAQPTQNSNADGLVLSNDGTNVYAFGTTIGTEGGQDRTITAVKWDTTSWSNLGVITPAGGRGNGDDITGPDVAGGGRIPIAYLFNDCDTSGLPFTYEVHALTLATVGTRTVPSSIAIQTTSTRTVPSSIAVTTTQARVVPATVAVLTTQARTVPASISVSITSTRTVPASIAVRTTNTRVVPATFAIQTTNARIVPSTFAIQTTQARTIPATIAVSIPRIVPASFAIQTTQSRTIPASVAILTTQARVVPATIAVLTTSVRTVPATIAVQTSSVRVVPATFALQTTQARVIPATIAISVARIIPASIAILTTQARVVPASISISGGATRTVPATIAVSAVEKRVVPASIAVTTIQARVIGATIAIATTGTRTVPASIAITIVTLPRIIPASVAVATTNTRTIPASIAINTTLQRSVPASIAVQTTQARIVPATIAVSGPSIRVVPASIAVSTVSVRTIPATVAVVTTQARSVPATIAVTTTQIRSVPASIAIQATLTRTVPSTIAVSTVNVRSIPATIAVQTLATRVVPSSIAIVFVFQRSVPASMAVQTTTARVVPATISLSLGANRVVPATIAIRVTSTRSVPSSIAVRTVETRVVPTSVAIVTTQQRTVPATVSVSTTQARIIPASISISAVVDASLSLSATSSMSIDGKFDARGTFAFDAQTTFSFATERITDGSFQFSAAANVTMASTINVAASAAFSSSSSMTVLGLRDVGGTVALSASGSLSIAAYADYLGSFVFAAQTSQVLVGSGTYDASLIFSADTDLLISAVVIEYLAYTDVRFYYENPRSHFLKEDVFEVFKDECSLDFFVREDEEAEDGG